MRDHVHELAQQRAHVGVGEVTARGVLLHHQRHRVEGAARAVGVQRGDGAGVPGGGAAQPGEGRAVAQLLEQHAVGAHAERGLQQVAGGHLREALRALRVEQVDAVGVRHLQFRRVLDRDDALVLGDGAD